MDGKASTSLVNVKPVKSQLAEY